MRSASVRNATQFVRRLGRELLEMFLPGSCCLCQGEVSNYRQPHVVCENCMAQQAKWRKCPRCSAVLIHDNELPQDDCPECHHLQLPFESITAVGNYADSLGEAILTAKTHRGAATAWDLGQLLAENLPSTWQIDPIIVAVPMHWTRRVRRGMNSAEILAHSLAARQGWKRQKLIACHRRLAKQSELSFTARKNNVRGAFQIVGPVPADRPILLVDDILTTGSTLTEIARTLRKAGAQEIHVAVVARSAGTYADV